MRAKKTTMQIAWCEGVFVCAATPPRPVTGIPRAIIEVFFKL
jgi:hypothetical protein